MEGRPRTNSEQGRVLAQGRCSGECQRLKSDIYLSLSVWHSTSITNFPQENLLSEAFSLTILSLTVFILRELFYSIFIFYIEFWRGHNLRVHLSIGCPVTLCWIFYFILQQAAILMSFPDQDRL